MWRARRRPVREPILCIVEEERQRNRCRPAATLRADGCCGQPRGTRLAGHSSSPMSLHRLLLAGFMHRFLSRSDESADLARAGAPANVLYGTLRRPGVPACGSRNAAGAQRTPDDFVAAVENLCIIPATSLISPPKPHQQTSSYLWSATFSMVSSPGQRLQEPNKTVSSKSGNCYYRCCTVSVH